MEVIMRKHYCLFVILFCVIVFGCTTKAYAISAPKSVTTKLTQSGDVEIKWSKVKSVKGYKVYRKQYGGKWKRIKTTSKTSFIDKKVSEGKRYKYYVVSYKGKKKSSKKYSSGYVCPLAKGTIQKIKVTSVLDSQVKLTWKKLKGVSGYELRVSLNDSTRYNQVKDTSFSVKLYKDQKYKISVRAYKSFSGKKYYGAWSSIHCFSWHLNTKHKDSDDEPDKPSEPDDEPDKPQYDINDEDIDNRKDITTQEEMLNDIAPYCSSRVIEAFRTLGYTIKVVPGIAQSGKFSVAEKSILLDIYSRGTLLHEMGHFLSFLAYNAADSKSFNSIYLREKNLLTSSNYKYVTSSPQEYFAESYRNFCEAPLKLQSSRPDTYSYIVACMAKVTDARISELLEIYRLVH